ncbi:MAG: uroporphyrinogen decarboxylase [Dissulfurispiraceae bacterium]|jgi:uroporphyrinogen decarboxylase|nr:uroporphyrinogen decarboxylase [Dissulfurispiraceae bacterium]
MNDTFLKACRGEKTDYTPVWIMRQAGRYLPEYQKVRSKVDFLTLCKTPELAVEVTLQPVDILGVDAAILFSDILIPVEAIGMKLEFSESKGPILYDPLRDSVGISKLRTLDPAEDVPFVMEAIKLLKKSLKVPLIGFSGAPFTLATYMIEGGSSRNYVNTKRMMYKEPEMFHRLMDKITDCVISYLNAQIDAGVDAVQIFDSWAGILSPADFDEFVLKYVQKIISSINPGLPRIYFAFNCGAMLSHVKASGADVLGLDWRIDMSDAINALGSDTVVQGNLDPCTLFGTQEIVSSRAAEIVKKGFAAKGHIFNLGHGILPETPVENAKALVEAVHSVSSKGR